MNKHDYHIIDFLAFVEQEPAPAVRLDCHAEQRAEEDDANPWERLCCPVITNIGKWNFPKNIGEATDTHGDFQ